jgi:hypothetical protein
MRMPLERPRPGVQHRQRTDVATEVSWICAQRCERLESRSEQHPDKLLLMRTHQLSQLRRHREHDVEVRHWE